jgi:hypothetical protein
MSADNWAQCPRCTVRAEAALQVRADEVAALYGAVNVDEFDRARADLGQLRADFDDRRPTFKENYEIWLREDYENWGAEPGVVEVSYSGTCTQCNLSLSFTDQHPIPDWGPAS